MSHIEGVHIGARALINIKLTWLGYIAHLSRWGRWVYLTFSIVSYLSSRRLENLVGGGGWSQHPVGKVRRSYSFSFRDGGKCERFTFRFEPKKNVLSVIYYVKFLRFRSRQGKM
jgi:hypothetical protein